MKANLKKKQLLPLSRATWSVLHDRHYFQHHRHRPHNYNLFTGEDEHSVQNLSKTSRSSNDPGAKGALSKLLHLQPSSNLKATPTYLGESITSRQRRYMCGQSSFFTRRSSSKANKNSDLSIQVVSRSGFLSIPHTRELEIA